MAKTPFPPFRFKTALSGLSGVGKVIRHRRVIRDNLEGISKASIRRLARRGGVKRLSGMMYPVIRGSLQQFLQRIVQTAVIYCSHARRKTITVYDIIYALKHDGRALYGFGDMTDLTAKCPRMRKKKPLRSKRSVIQPVVESQTHDQVVDIGPDIERENVDLELQTEVDLEPQPQPEVDIEPQTEVDLESEWMDVRDINFRGKATPPPKSKKKTYIKKVQKKTRK